MIEGLGWYSPRKRGIRAQRWLFPRRSATIVGLIDVGDFCECRNESTRLRIKRCPRKRLEFQQLVRGICAGSENAMSEFIGRYGEHLHRYVRRKLNQQLPLRVRFESQDFVQMVWASFFAGRDEISQFKEPAQLVGYLVAMARNKVISEMRRCETDKGGDIRRTQSLAVLETGGNEPSANDASPSNVVDAREQLQRLLSRASQRDRRIIELRMTGKTFAEVAAELAIDERTARRAISRLIRVELS